MLINFYCFTSHVYYFRLEIYDKTIIEYSLCFFHLKCIIKQLLDEVFVICRIINVSVRVISRAEGEADNSYRDIDSLPITKTESNNCFIIHCNCCCFMRCDWSIECRYIWDYHAICR